MNRIGAGSIYYTTMHSPRGANASFAFGAAGEGGGFLHGQDFIPEQDIYIGIQRGKVLKCLLFLKNGVADGEEAYSTDAAVKETRVRLVTYRQSEVRRTLGFAMDRWETDDLTFEILTPVSGVPDPATASPEALALGIVPALVARLVLESHPRVERVLYPGLPSHPQYELAKRQMSGFSGLIGFLLKGTSQEQIRFANHLDCFARGPSWGGYESLVMPVGVDIRQEGSDREGFPIGLVRLSIGLENPDTLIDSIERAFTAMRQGG